jgi:hypothetical protein
LELLGASGISGVPWYGQSNSVGRGAYPAYTLAQPYANVTFEQGLKAPASGLTAFKPAVEDNNSENARPSTTTGETGSVVMVNRLVAMAQAQRGVDPALNRYCVSNPGQGGSSLAVISRRGRTWNRLVAHAMAMASIAAAMGKAFRLQLMPMVHGETDADLGTPEATYISQGLQLDADVQAILRPAGQRSPVHLLWAQCSYGVKKASAGAVVEAQRKICALSPTSHLVMPTYFLAYNRDRTHSNRRSKILVGEYMARASHQIVHEGREPDVVDAISAFAISSALTIYLRTPAPLVFDTATLGAAPDLGFKVLDDTGTLALSEGKAVGGKVAWRLNRPLGANPRVRYAMDHLGAGMNLEEGASGNLRDTSTDAVLVEGILTALPHWCLHFDIPILKLEG